MAEKNITIENARLAFRNFEGREGMYNAPGKRNFVVFLDQDIAEELARDGWLIKQMKPREEGEAPQPYISVTLGYSEKSRPPTVVMISSRGRTHLDENTVGTLDWVDIDNVDLSFRPYDWEVSGNTGRKAYLQALYVTINEDPLSLKYSDTGDIATVDGPMQEHTDPLTVAD